MAMVMVQKPKSGGNPNPKRAMVMHGSAITSSPTRKILVLEFFPKGGGAQLSAVETEGRESGERKSDGRGEFDFLPTPRTAGKGEERRGEERRCIMCDVSVNMRNSEMKLTYEVSSAQTQTN
jgi:hypothetical protein